jgi:threonine/homoserine/homoserine lactone efflux protein
MSFATWWLYVAMTFVICATPGPNMLLVMVSGARHGFRAAVATMAGCLTALLGMLSLSAAALRKPAVLKLFNRATGGLFIGFALLMADIRK